MSSPVPSPPETTSIIALVEARSPVIRYIGQSVDPRPRFVRQARSHGKGFRTVVLHETVDVGDVASFHVQEEIAHAVRAGHPLLNELQLPVNLLVDDGVRGARDLALRAVAVGDGTEDRLDQELAADREMCAAQAAARTSGVVQPAAHPAWRYDVRPARTGQPPAGFREVPDDPTADTPLLIDAATEPAQDLLRRFAVVRTAAGLQAIADGYVIWSTGQRARHNRDATAARFVREQTAELRLPRRDVGAVLDRHLAGATNTLAAIPGTELGRRDSLVLTTGDPDQLDELASTLIDMAVAVDASTTKPVRQRTTSHDTQQILLRASQALVLADELRRALGARPSGR
jgi:hypothetical protein